MYQVVKFGAYIVDALNAYKQPIMVYLPPRAELRGGSWVVIDPTINPSMMEMYSDPTASGGVLEPEAIVEIKYRSKDVRKTMERLDPVIKELMEEMGKSGVGATDKALLEERLKRREEQLAGVYHQVFTLTFSLIRFSLSLSPAIQFSLSLSPPMHHSSNLRWPYTLPSCTTRRPE